MRPLTEEETKTLFLKLSEYIGKNIEKMIHRSDERHCFRLMKDRCYYISESIMKAATSISRDNLLHAGTCIGKFTKSGKFRLEITALEYLSQYAKVRYYYNLLVTITGRWRRRTILGFSTIPWTTARTFSFPRLKPQPPKQPNANSHPRLPFSLSICIV